MTKGAWSSETTGRGVAGAHSQGRFRNFDTRSAAAGRRCRCFRAGDIFLQNYRTHRLNKTPGKLKNMYDYHNVQLTNA
jgi:hypothetical protein